jgi:tetratricopeptide (TPR) repeat protein
VSEIEPPAWKQRLARAVLKVQPDHFGAMHYLGLIAARRGKFEDAESLLRRAVAVNPNSAEAMTNLGIVLTALRRFLEANDTYERALALDPSHVEAHNNFGVMLQTIGRFDKAITEFATALRLRPGGALLHNNLGTALSALGRTKEAVAEYEKAIAIDAHCTDAQNNLGNALVTLGRHERAVAQFYRALDLSPDSATTHNALSMALLAAKRYEAAVGHCRRAIEIKPDFAMAHNNLGLALAALKRHDEAITKFRHALEIKPGLAEVHNNLGNALAALNRRDEAVAEYRRAIEIKPDFPEAHYNLGNSLGTLQRYNDAIPHFRKALETRPEFAAALGKLALALTALNRHDEALICYERSLAIEPDVAEVHFGYGNQLMILGRLKESRQQFKQAIALAPARPQSYRSLAAVKSFSAGDPELVSMEALAADMSGLTDDDRMDLHFALGKAQADISNHESAFQHLKAANALKRRQTDYDEAAVLKMFERIAAAFTPDVMRRLAGCGDPSALPVFIVGMPRSGTTLVEQVLASHPLVFGAGEIGDLEVAVAAVGSSEDGQQFPEAIGSMTGEQLRRIGTYYRDRVAARAPAALRITDKLLTNFRLVGLIHLALPNARIIHVRRQPADTCLSCFFSLFGGYLPFTYDLAELGRYYRAYAGLMAYWRSVLPKDAMMEVRYEDLVADFPAHARRLVAYCGLEWDERCSTFYETRRPITTSSAAQVRRPIYQDAVGRWRPYEHLLGPLLDMLEVEP